MNYTFQLHLGDWIFVLGCGSGDGVGDRRRRARRCRVLSKHQSLMPEFGGCGVERRVLTQQDGFRRLGRCCSLKWGNVGGEA